MIIAIIAAIPGAFNAPAGGDEVAAQVSTAAWTNKSFNHETAQRNLKSYGSSGGIGMSVTYSGFIIAIVFFVLVI